MELPAPGTNEQAGPAPVAGQGERIPDLETRDETRTPNQETIVTENTHRPVEQPTPHPTPNRTAETEGRPRRETRRPVKYADYECYTLQSGTDQSESRRKSSDNIGEIVTNELAAKEENSRKLIHYAPVINSEQGFQ